MNFSNTSFFRPLFLGCIACLWLVSVSSLSKVMVFCLLRSFGIDCFRSTNEDDFLFNLW